MFVDLRKIGNVTVRNVIPVILSPDKLLDTNFEPGQDVYIAYGKEMIVICKDLDIVNKLAEKDHAIIIESVKRKRGS